MSQELLDFEKWKQEFLFQDHIYFIYLEVFELV